MVSDTRIFARLAAPGRQMLAYEMSFASAADTAMVLPLPVASRDEEHALRFIDLSARPDFFDRLAEMIWLFEETQVDGSGDLSSESSPVRAPLKVHEVGAFDASFVPSVGDFDRLDARFRLPVDIWGRLPLYRDYGFAVFKLRATGASARHAHPMAFEFSTRLADKLFAPTVHLHDGRVSETACFDHIIYAQAENGWELRGSVFFEQGRADAGSQRRLGDLWANTRSRGDWRIPRDRSEARGLGMRLPAGPTHPLRGLLPQEGRTLVELWRSLGPRGQARVRSWISITHTLTALCRSHADGVREALETPPGQRGAWDSIQRWQDIALALDLTAESVERWQALAADDRRRVLHGEDAERGDAAAVAWMQLPPELRERFGRLHRWSAIESLMTRETQRILKWMAMSTAAQARAKRIARAKDALPLIERDSEALRRCLDADPTQRNRTIHEEAPAFDPDAGAARQAWSQISPDHYYAIGKIAHVMELAPLLDPSSRLFAVGLSGMLPNADTIIEVN
jgi:hypothetical protein